MSKNPILNALTATAYITLVSSIMYYGTQFAPKNDSFLAPIAMLSLFTLSAAVMGYLFCYQPLLLLFAKKHKAALNLFLQTLSVFAVTTTLFLLLLFSGLI